MGLRMRLDCSRNIRQVISRDHLVYSEIQTLFGYAQQLFQVLRDFTDRHGNGRIAVITVVNHSKVEAHDIPFLEFPMAGDAVDHFMIDGSAKRAGETAITLESRGSAALEGLLFCNSIQLASCYPRLNQWTQLLQDLSHNLAGVPHDFQLSLGFKRNHWIPVRVLRLGRAPLDSSKDRSVTKTCVS